MPRKKNPSASRGQNCDPRAAETEYSPDDLEQKPSASRNRVISPDPPPSGMTEIDEGRILMDPPRRSKAKPKAKKKKSGEPVTIRSNTGSLGYSVPVPEPDPNEYRGETVPRSFGQTDDETGLSLPGSKLISSDPMGDDLSSLAPKGHRLRLTSGSTSIPGPTAAPAVSRRKRNKARRARSRRRSA